MTKKIIISEKDNIAAVLEDNKVCEFFVSKGDVLLGDVYLSRVDNVLPSIEAAFVDVGMPDKMGFIHTDDIAGKGTLKEKVKPNQKLIVQVVKEPTGHKGPRVTTALSLPGRFLVLLPDEKGVNVSKKITSQKERARLKSIVSLLKPVGVGVIVRTEAEGQSDAEIQEDLEILLEKWNSIVNAADSANPPTLLYRDQDLLYRVIREACDSEVEEIIVDTAFALHRTTQLLQHWNMQVRVSMHKGNDPLLVSTGVNKEIEKALNTRVNLPLGGYLFIQQTEALTVVDVNSGKFTSSSNQAETILKTNIQAADEIARQLKLRNIGGMVIVDFIDMASRMDKLALLEHFELVLEKDKAKPQIGQLSDLGLVELTRHRQGQSLSEIFTKKCDKCNGQGFIIDDLKFATSTSVGENRAKLNKIKGPFGSNFNSTEQAPNQNNKNHKFDKNNRRDKNKNRHQNKEFAQEQNQESIQENNFELNQPIEKETQELTKAKVNELIDDLIKDVVIDGAIEAIEERKEEVVKEEKIETTDSQDEKLQDKEDKPVKKLSRKAKKTKKKEDVEAPVEQAVEEQISTEEKPKKRTRRISAKKTS
ncbi:MAG: Rne/Rng family ribonuclease [Candidatus Gastranaerophilales bacterium]|nr:Rne/Rng family ribonuclease [Candidatus Gastranaerophilales bacterium]